MHGNVTTFHDNVDGELLHLMREVYSDKMAKGNIKGLSHTIFHPGLVPNLNVALPVQ
jgi:hypothetical protein